ncbi:hypothetical protein ACJIZ3_008045 [Penstemon smallii]|uniref:Protein RER1 n=1 Tax=Penstemon smallii TaxID=265156 RepID=A0ABD3T8P3_9LAMI
METPSTTTTAAAEADGSSAAVARWTFTIFQRFQHVLDKVTPYVLHRWIAFFCIAFLYVVRVYLVKGCYLVSYGLSFYIIHLLLGFLSPKVDPELCDSPTLPIRGSDEFRPSPAACQSLNSGALVLSITIAFCIGFALTFSSLFDVPVFWPLLIFDWIMLKKAPSAESERLLPLSENANASKTFSFSSVA